MSECIQQHGIKCYAPELAGGNADYPVEAFEKLFQSEAGSFWFRARQRIIEHFIQRYLSGHPATFLEIGCGTGYVLQGLSRMKNLRLTGAELNLSGLKWAAKRLPDVELVQLDATRLPYINTFDAIGAFDVIEHIEDDNRVLTNIFAALNDHGLLFITVPQHRCLWSQADEYGMHKRRYSRKELIEKLVASGFEPLVMTSFVSLLFPAMYASRFLNRKRKPQVSSEVCELHLPPLLDRIGDRLMAFEEKMIFAGVSLYWGGSLFTVARKKSE